jgi:hypothetical protein
VLPVFAVGGLQFGKNIRKVNAKKIIEKKDSFSSYPFWE